MRREESWREPFHIVSAENTLTSSKHPIPEVHHLPVGLSYPIPLYLPQRPDIKDIIHKWEKASIEIHDWYPLDEEGEPELWLVRHKEYYGNLHSFANELNRRNHIDLAHQAVTEANSIEQMLSKDKYFNKKATIERYSGGRIATSKIDKPVYFVIDFDHTLARTNTAHANLIKTCYSSLPQDTRERISYADFLNIFQQVYTSHQKVAGMHKPDVFINELTENLKISNPTQEMLQMYEAYYDSFKGNMFEDVVLILNRWLYLGKSLILTFGDQRHQEESVRRSGILDFTDKLKATGEKSPKVIDDALKHIGYKPGDYVIGIGDKPSDAKAIKTFKPEALSIRMRHKDGKYSSSLPKSDQEIPDFEYSTWSELDLNLHTVFKRMLERKS